MRPYRAPPRPDPRDCFEDWLRRARKTVVLQGILAVPGRGLPNLLPARRVGHFFPKAVRMYAVDGAAAREILYDPTYFTAGRGHVAAGLGEQLSAFAGFWAHEPARKGDLDEVKPWATFLGASYFRGVGELVQIGLSARGIALAPGGPDPEEFPDFIAYWLEPAESEEAPQ